MAEPVRVTPQAVTAAAKAAYREDHGTDCRHRWDAADDETREFYRANAKAGLTAAVPLLCQPLQDEIDRLRAQIDDLGEQIAQQIEKIPTRYGSGARRDVNRVIGTAADIARAAAVPVGTGNPTQPRADD